MWTSIVGILTRRKLAKDIPEHDHFLSYGPEYELNTSPGLIKNKNTHERMNEIVHKVFENLDKVNIE